MNWVNIGKTVLRFVVGGSVGLVVKNAIKATTPNDLSTFNKISVEVGSYIVSGLLSQKAADYVEAEVVEMVNAVKGSLAEGYANDEKEIKAP